MPEPKKILTAEEFTALRAQSDEQFPRRRNVGLHKGGAVDIYTSTKGDVVAVLRGVELTDKNRAALEAEIAPLIAKESAKGAPKNPAQPVTDSTAETEN